MEQQPAVNNEQLNAPSEDDHENSDDYEYESLEPTNMDKWRYTLYTTMFALIIFNKYIYKFVETLIGKYIKIASADGNPTLNGFFIHLLIFTLILRVSMDYDI